MQRRISIRPLNPNIGSLVTGARVRDLTDTEIGEIKATVVNRGIVVLPGQFVTARELDRLGDRFGESFLPAQLPTVDGTNCVTELINNFAYGDMNYRTNRFHTDSTHMERPPSFTFISCVESAPNGGGDTIWCNQYLAYETLPDDVKQSIRGLRVTFKIHDHYLKHSDPSVQTDRTHPLVRVHPETGRKAIYIGDSIAGARIEGLPAQEGEALRAYLYQHCQTPEHCYRHRWSKGDLVLWDNRCTMHYAVLDYSPDDTRIMIRLMVAGELPIAEAELEAAPRVLVSQ